MSFYKDLLGFKVSIELRVMYLLHEQVSFWLHTFENSLSQK